jgi:hypothetical protein
MAPIHKPLGGEPARKKPSARKREGADVGVIFLPAFRLPF